MTLGDPANQTPTRPSEVPRDAADESVGYRDMSRTTGSTVRSGIAWSVAGQWAGFVVQTVVTAVLARLVSPRDFGILSEALTVAALANQLQSLGLSQAVIQRATLTHGQMSGLFWVNVGAGGILAMLMSGAAPLVAAFYGDPHLLPVTMVLSLSYLISGFGVQHAALLARRMRFRAIALRSLAPRILSGAIAIAAAALGGGYWALVVQQICNVFFTVLFVWTAIRWRPSWPRRRTGVRPLVRFGAHVRFANLLYYFSGNADNILVGKFLGAFQLGLYARAYNLFLVPIRQIQSPMGNVIQPVLAALIGEPARYRQFYRRALFAIGIVGIPGVAALAVMSHGIISVVLGNRWLGAVEPFRWLAITGLLQMAGSWTFGWLFVTSGRSRAMAVWAMISSPVIVASFIVGLHWGIVGVAAAHAISQLALAPPLVWYATRGTPVSVMDVLTTVWRPALVGTAVGAAAWAASHVVGGSAPLASTAAGSGAAALCWAGAVLLWPSVRADMRSLLSSATSRRK